MVRFDKANPVMAETSIGTGASGCLLCPLLLATALIGFVVESPRRISSGYADAAQAEFVGTDFVPELTPPTRLAGPKSEIRIVKA